VLVQLTETKGLKMLRNMQTCWVSLIEPLRRLLFEYRTLIYKMIVDLNDNKAEVTISPQPSCFEKKIISLECIFLKRFCFFANYYFPPLRWILLGYNLIESQLSWIPAISCVDLCHHLMALILDCAF